MSSSGGGPPVIPPFGGEPRRTGPIRRRAKVECEYVLGIAPNALTTGYTWSQPLNVDQYLELIIIASLTVAASGSAAGFGMAVIALDPVYSNLAAPARGLPIEGLQLPASTTVATPAFAPIDASEIIVTAPGNAHGPIAGLILRNFGAMICIGVKAATHWDNTDIYGLSVSYQGKV